MFCIINAEIQNDQQLYLKEIYQLKVLVLFQVQNRRVVLEAIFNYKKKKQFTAKSHINQIINIYFKLPNLSILGEMQKISLNRFKLEQKNRLKTSGNQIPDMDGQKSKVKIKYHRYSNIQTEITQQTQQTYQNKPHKSGFSRRSQSSGGDILLRNMMKSNQRKRFQILNSLIKDKRKLFHSSSKNDQSFRKMIKTKTQEKQNFNQTIKMARQKNTLSSNKHALNTFRQFNQQICMHQQQKLRLKSQRKSPNLKLSARESQFLKNSFNKRIKEIKIRKYFQKDQMVDNQTNIFEAYGASIIGDKHEQNQDSIHFSQGIYVVCDGHGTNGKQISNLISQAVHNSLSQCIQENKMDETSILQTYRKIDLQLENSSFDISFSGCTCVTVLRWENSLYCISLGDSRAILCKGYTVSEISSTQKPDKPKQKERIQNYGGVVRQSEISKDKFAGPMRIWAPGKNSWGPGLALSRAFGDKASRRYGVISVPQISKINMTSDEQFIVIGSDGLFDFFGDQQICQFVRKLLKDDQISRQQIPNQLVQQARTKWNNNSDDISCIIIFM